MKKLLLTFYIKKDKENEAGESPLFVKISVNGSQTTMAIPYKIETKRWFETKQLKLARKPSDVFIRSAIIDMKTELNEILSKLESSSVEITAEQLKSAFLNKDSVQKNEGKTLLEIYDWHNNRYALKVGLHERGRISLQKHRNFRTKIKDFLLFKYNESDILLSKLNFQFIDDFDMYLRLEKHLQHNSVIKVIQGVRKVLRDAIKHDWLEKDPFVHYSEKEIEVETVYLTQAELTAIETKVLPIKRLDVVRDLFVFSCYTGYAPVDVQGLKESNLVIHSDEQQWIFTSRQKTKIKSNVLLLPKALEIISKYQDDECRKVKSLLFPSRSNQKINAYLKEIAVLCGITKTLHHYVARHTFATTVALANGISLESLSKMMGHKRITQTQHYGKIQDQRVSEEMSALKAKMYASKGTQEI